VSAISNRILLHLAPVDLAVLAPKLTLVELKLKQVIIEPHKTIKYVYFPEDAVLSLLARADDIQPIEIGMIGFEGVSDFVRHYRDTIPFQCVVQTCGRAWRMEASDYVEAQEDRPSFEETILRYKETLTVQLGYNALAHGSLKIERRLARWLLMSNDRSRRDSMPYVHHFMAAMLSVRRSGVTNAIHVLEGIGAIKATRGAIVIRDRAKLLEMAGGSYGIPEAEYERLMNIPSPAALAQLKGVVSAALKAHAAET
jgi:CRP-like cAMP-binding protein